MELNYDVCWRFADYTISIALGCLLIEDYTLKSLDILATVQGKSATKPNVAFMNSHFMTSDFLTLNSLSHSSAQRNISSIQLLIRLTCTIVLVKMPSSKKN